MSYQSGIESILLRCLKVNSGYKQLITEGLYHFTAPKGLGGIYFVCPV